MDPHFCAKSISRLIFSVFKIVFVIAHVFQTLYKLILIENQICMFFIFSRVIIKKQHIPQ